MRILYVDDERSAHINFYHITKEHLDISNVEFCFDYKSAMAYAREHRLDCAFLDVSLPDVDGITLGKDLQLIQPWIELVFITGYDEYAREAYKVGGRAYLTKPYSHDEMKQVLFLMEKLVHSPRQVVEKSYSESTHIFAKTFGLFDLMIDGYPVHFKSSKAKELMAYLVHQMGGTATNAQVFFALWEQQEYSRNTSTYVRRTLRALKEELEELGIEDILISRRNNIGVDVRKFTCDVYELMEGNAVAMRKYNGQYMSQYAWGEETIPLLDRIVNDVVY